MTSSKSTPSQKLLPAPSATAKRAHHSTTRHPDKNNGHPDKKTSSIEPKTTLNLRARIIELLEQVSSGQSLSNLLPTALNNTPERDRALFNELTLGSVRQWYRITKTLRILVPREPEPAVHAALVLGIYQLWFTRIPPHAASSETVTAIKQLNCAHASGLVNAVLRRCIREQDILQPQTLAHDSLPAWLSRQLQHDWPERYADLALQLNQAAPLCLRVNRRKLSRTDYLNTLTEHGLNAKLLDTPDGVLMADAVQIPQLPGYKQGWFSVQDAHAQLSGLYLDDMPQHATVLDACAAPGGKTAQLLEYYQPKTLYALDIDDERLSRIAENLSRLDLIDHANPKAVQLITADATTWQSPEPLDVILLDAPCTATGVLRRHPDIAMLRTAQDVAQTVTLQAQLLNALWPQLKIGGTLFYVTCSLLQAENELQMQDFLAKHADARAVPLTVLAHGEARPVGVQYFPAEYAGDGFYFAKLIKIDQSIELKP